ncbi:GOLD domain - like 1 [Theobroma cacao]|nr:GOLD domain - like 1 [Theobroma cacao]
METCTRYDVSAKFCFVLGCLVSCCVHHVFSLSITVAEFECVSELVVSEGDTISGNFVVTDHEIFWNSEHPGIEFTVTSPGGKLVYFLKGTSGDKFEFKAPRRGIYKFCFHNPLTTPETVAFYLHVGHIPETNDVAINEHFHPTHVKIAELREVLESVTAEQKYLKARDARHRYTSESTRKRVVFYTLVEYFALAASSVLQIVYIRRLFSSSPAYNRV